MFNFNSSCNPDLDIVKYVIIKNKVCKIIPKLVDNLMILMYYL